MRTNYYDLTYGVKFLHLIASVARWLVSLVINRLETKFYEVIS